MMESQSRDDKTRARPPARKCGLCERVFLFGLRRVVRRRFHGVFVRGVEHVRAHEAAASGRPLLLCANHSNWWDGFALALTAPFFPTRSFYVAQEARLLAQYWPLRWLGAFPLSNHGSPLPGLRRALALLEDPRRAVLIFPQGDLLPPWVPIEAKPGPSWLSRRSGADVIPVALRYEWMIESRPSLFIHFGEALPPGTEPARLTAAMRALFEEIGRTLAPPDLSGYVPLFPPRPSLNAYWDRWVPFRNDA